LEADTSDGAALTGPLPEDDSGQPLQSSSTSAPRQHELHHLELACKFYLITAEAKTQADAGEAIATTPWEHFVGPDGDTLAWKYAKMRDVQVRWSSKAPLRDSLPHDPLPWLWVQGRFGISHDLHGHWVPQCGHFPRYHRGNRRASPACVLGVGGASAMNSWTAAVAWRIHCTDVLYLENPTGWHR